MYANFFSDMVSAFVGVITRARKFGYKIVLFRVLKARLKTQN